MPRFVVMTTRRPRTAAAFLPLRTAPDRRQVGLLAQHTRKETFDGPGRVLGRDDGSARTATARHGRAAQLFAGFAHRGARLIDDADLQRESAVKDVSLGIFDPSVGIFDPARCRRNPDFLGGFRPKPRSVLRNRQGTPRLSRVSSRARVGCISQSSLWSGNKFCAWSEKPPIC